MVLGCGVETLALFTLVTAVHGIFQHANLQLRLGSLNHFFSMAELHRWHHSKSMEEANHNYGQTVIVWDTLFGTRFLPADREPPEEIGIPNLPSPHDLVGPDLIAVSLGENPPREPGARLVSASRALISCAERGRPMLERKFGYLEPRSGDVSEETRALHERGYVLLPQAFAAEETSVGHAAELIRKRDHHQRENTDVKGPHRDHPHQRQAPVK